MFCSRVVLFCIFFAGRTFVFVQLFVFYILYFCIYFVFCIFRTFCIFVFLTDTKICRILYFLKHNFVFVSIRFFGKYPPKKTSYFPYLQKMQIFSLELRTGKNHENQRNVVRLPDNPERLLQNTRGPASHSTHINAYQLAIYMNIAGSFAFLLGLYF